MRLDQVRLVVVLRSVVVEHNPGAVRQIDRTVRAGELEAAARVGAPGCELDCAAVFRCGVERCLNGLRVVVLAVAVRTEVVDLERCGSNVGYIDE